MLSLENFCFPIVLALVSCVLAADNDNVKDQGSVADGSGPLWFGPRLGKRSPIQSTEDNSQALFKLLEAAETFNYYRDYLPYFEGLATESETKGHSQSSDEERMIENAEFISRLGRHLSNGMANTPTVQNINRPDTEQMISRTKYVSGLGRIMNFSPRLGRELEYEMLPEKPREVRSIKKRGQHNDSELNAS